MDLETSITVQDTKQILSELGIYIEKINDELTYIEWEFLEELN